MDITNEAARFPKTANIVVELHGLTTLLGRNHVAGRYYKRYIDRKTCWWKTRVDTSNRVQALKQVFEPSPVMNPDILAAAFINLGGFRRGRQSDSFFSTPPPTLTPTCRFDPLNIMDIDEGVHFMVYIGSPWPGFHLYSMSMPPNIRQPNHCYSPRHWHLHLLPELDSLR